MLNFTFYNPTKIHFGEGQIEKISSEIPEQARILMIYGGGSIKSNGVYDQVKNVLEGRKWFEFSGIEPNPQYDTVIKATDIIKKHKIDYLLGVGGGSVIDAVKFIAAAAEFEGDDPWKILTGEARVAQALPFGCVLTLPATGSESNSGSVITRGDDKLFFGSSKVYPAFSVLDPSITLSLSDRQISNGVIDAFAHTLEQYLTYPVGAKVQDRFSEGLLQTLVEEGPKALTKVGKTDLQVRSNIMWSATLALNGLIGSGVPQDWTTHMIGHELTGLHGIDHARSLSIIYPAVLKVCRQSKREKLLQYAKRVWNIDGNDEQQTINKAIEKTVTFFKHMQMPTCLADVNLSEQDIEPILAKLEQHGMTALGEHETNTLEISRQILQVAC